MLKPDLLEFQKTGSLDRKEILLCWGVLVDYNEYQGCSLPPQCIVMQKEKEKQESGKKLFHGMQYHN